MKVKKKKPLIFIIVKRGAIFFFLMCLMLIFLYILGAFQQFTDAALLMLLRLAGFFGLFLGMNGAFGIILEIWFFFRKENFHILFNIILFFLFGSFGIVVAVFTFFIQALTGGYGK